MSATHGGRIFEIARERGWDWRDILDFSASLNPLGHIAATGPTGVAANRDARQSIVKRRFMAVMILAGPRRPAICRAS